MKKKFLIIGIIILVVIILYIPMITAVNSTINNELTGIYRISIWKYFSNSNHITLRQWKKQQKY